MSETGKQVAILKSQTSEYNKNTVQQQQYIRQAASSYDRLSADLKEHVALYKSLSQAERENSNMGKAVLDNILNIKNQINDLNAQMKPHIDVMTEVQKAEQRLVF